MYSAVRVGGRRLHEAARAGERVERTPRAASAWTPSSCWSWASPRAGSAAPGWPSAAGRGPTSGRWRPTSAGRSGSPRTWPALRRTAAGSFTLAEAISLEQAENLRATAPEDLSGRVLPLEEALRGWPTVLLTAGEARDLGHGKALPLPAVPDGLCGALAPHGAARSRCAKAAPGTLRPLRVLAPSIR